MDLFKWLFTGRIQEAARKDREASQPKVMYQKTISFTVGRVLTMLHLKDGGFQKGPAFYGYAYTYQDAPPTLGMSAREAASRECHRILCEPCSVETIDGMFLRSTDIDRIEITSVDEDFTKEFTYLSERP